MNPRILATIGAVVLLAGCADNPPPPSPFLIIFGAITRNTINRPTSRVEECHEVRSAQIIEGEAQVLTYRVCGSPDVGWHVEAP